MVRGLPRRRGGVYVLALGTALLVTVIGVSALLVARGQRIAIADAQDFCRARHAALAAIDVGLEAMEASSNWRTLLPSGAWVTSASLGGARLSLRGEDPDDGNLTDNKADPVVLTGTGYCGHARYQVSVRLVPPVVPLPILAHALHAQASVDVKSGNTLTLSGGPLSSNGSVTTSGNVVGDVIALSVSNPARVTGQITAPGPTHEAPDASVFAAYAALATPLATPSTMEKTVLSPACNPWGRPALEGVYFLNLTGNTTIRNMRIVGTLVVRSNGKNLVIDQNVLIEPARRDYPALIVDGNVDLNVDSAGTLSEAARAVNFNPPGTAWQGVADDDQTDTYPSEIRGLVHVRGTLKLRGTTLIRGAVICESSASVEGNTRIVTAPTLAEQPPKGYTTFGTPEIVPGTWQQTLPP